jgi:Trk K+ transport system NAD-binding subunit
VDTLSPDGGGLDILALGTIIVIILVSLLVARVATAAFMLTGLSRDTSRFQARSALTGVGFTTSEAEMVVNHPVRRKIAMMLMLLGSAGLVTVIATLILSFANAQREQTFERLGLLIVVLGVMVLLSRSRFVEGRLNRMIGIGLSRWTDLTDSGLARLLHLGGVYGVAEVAVDDHDWIAGRTLEDLDLRSEGVAVLALVCSNGTYIGAPVFEMKTRPGDTLILYGPSHRLEDLDHRRIGAEGERARVSAVAEQLDRARVEAGERARADAEQDSREARRS